MKRKSLRRSLTNKQNSRIIVLYIAAVRSEKSHRCSFIYCGMRKGEALGLEYKDIDFDRSVLSIRRTSNYHQGFGTYTDTPKTKSSIRDLQIAPLLVKMIHELQAEQKERAKQCGDQWVDSDRLFVNWCGEPLHPNIPYKWLQRFCEAEKSPSRDYIVSDTSRQLTLWRTVLTWKKSLIC